jgi:hypothetical protein
LPHDNMVIRQHDAHHDASLTSLTESESYFF